MNSLAHYEMTGKPIAMFMKELYDNSFENAAREYMMYRTWYMNKFFCSFEEYCMKSRLLRRVEEAFYHINKIKIDLAIGEFL